MKMYQAPNMFLVEISDYVAMAQSGGQIGQAPLTASCSFGDCFDAVSSGNDSSDFIVSWEDSDNNASEANNYTVTVNMNGNVFAITNSTPNCQFSFGSTFQVSCQNFDSGSNGCIFNGTNTLTIVSIEDPQGNVFSPSGEDCTFQNEQG